MPNFAPVFQFYQTPAQNLLFDGCLLRLYTDFFVMIACFLSHTGKGHEPKLMMKNLKVSIIISLDDFFSRFFISGTSLIQFTILLQLRLFPWNGLRGVDRKEPKIIEKAIRRTHRISHDRKFRGVYVVLRRPCPNLKRLLRLQKTLFSL